VKFNPDHKVDIKTLAPDEAVTFIRFLQDEIERHQDSIHQARVRIEFEESAILRHSRDIGETQALIDKVRKDKLPS